MGGEKANGSDAPDDDEGSPPRRRGKVGENHLVAQLPGITPAQAGKSLPWRKQALFRGDHPRTGGEKLGKISAPNIGQGSPPHRRGKVHPATARAHGDRITPAQAGKRNWAIGSRLLNWDHPRVGGEKIRQSIWYSTT